MHSTFNAFSCSAKGMLSEVVLVHAGLDLEVHRLYM